MEWYGRGKGEKEKVAAEQVEGRSGSGTSSRHT